MDSIFTCLFFMEFYHPYNSFKNIRLPMHSKLQEDDAMWHINSSLCGPPNLHVSPCSTNTSSFSCIYLISYIIKYLFHSNVWKSFIRFLIKIPNVSIQPRELVGLIELSSYAIIKNGDIIVLRAQYFLSSINLIFVSEIF